MFKGSISKDNSTGFINAGSKRFGRKTDKNYKITDKKAN